MWWKFVVYSEQEPETLWIFHSGKRTAFHGGLSNLPFLVKSSGFPEVNKRENITHDWFLPHFQHQPLLAITRFGIPEYGLYIVRT